MKKVIILSLISLLIFALTGCAFGGSTNSATSGVVTTNSITTTATVKPTTTEKKIKTLKDYGWIADENIYTGWSVSDDGSVISAESERSSRRIYGDLIEEPRSFRLTIDFDGSLESAPYIRVLENTIELDARHGTGDQVFVKGLGNDDWLAATGAKCAITIERYNTDTINVTITGEGGASRDYTFETDSTSTYVELGLYAGSATFENLKIRTLYLPVNEYGFESDSADYSGWTAISTNGVECDYTQATNKRLWKSMIEDQDDFWIELDIKVNAESSAYIKAFGIQVEFDSRHGSANQVYVKCLGSDDWFDATNGEITVSIENDSTGSVIIEVKGKDNNSIMKKTLNKLEASSNLELGAYAGNVSFENITCHNIVDKIIRENKNTNHLYSELAKLAVNDNLKNWWYGDTETGYIHPTHSGRKLNPTESAPIWEGAMVLYGVYELWFLTKSDDYKQYLIAEANYYKSNYEINPGNLENPAGRPGPASDDCAWASMLYIIFYEVTGDAWFLTRSANLCKKTQDRWYDEELGGMRYSDTNEAMSLYETGLTLSWLRLYELTLQEKYYNYALASYTRLHEKLYYNDGIYYCEVDKTGPRGGEFRITEAGSSSFLAGNMAMATIAAKLYKITNDQMYLDRVYATNAGILKWYNNDGVLLNDRDAWTEGTYAAYYASNVLTLDNTEEMRELFLNTALSIMRNARTEDGRYAGTWQGPAVGEGSRWYRGGSVPEQIMTSGSTVQMVTAAALLEAGINNFTR